MKIILLERIAKLGRLGDVVSVRDGYARNYLLPRQRALRATAANIAYFEEKREEIEARNLKERAHAEDIAVALEGKMFTSIQQAGESGQLYGSVNARKIAQLLKAQGFSISHNQIVLDMPIKALGVHPVQVELHSNVAATIRVNAARSEEEAARQSLATQEERKQEQPAGAGAMEQPSAETNGDAKDIPSPADSEEENRVA